jgi:flavorubredoxin
MEPDHSANIEKIAGIYPDMKIIGNKRTFPMLANFTSLDLDGRTVTVGEGSTLDLCGHELKFILAPMVHWPEVMMTYDATSKILFSADAFGRFGSTDEKDDADFSEARRYYFNIVGKYGAQVSAVLEKAKTLDIRKICSLHGPVIEKRLAAYLEKYSIWSAYKAECPENITVAYASIHGNTRQAAQFLAEEIGGKAELYDLGRCDLSEAVSAAFKNGKIILLCSTYDGGIFTPMKNYISRLQSKTFRMRKVAFVENGSWAPQAGKLMRAEFECMPAMTFCEKTVTVMSSVKETTKTQLSALAETVLKM